MNKLLLASVLSFFALPAFAQFNPPSQPPQFKDLGGVLSGVGTGISFTTGPVAKIPAFTIIQPGGDVNDLAHNSQLFLGKVTPRP